MSFGFCSTHQRDPKGHRACKTCFRIAIEGEIATKTIDALLDAGYFIDVFDCEEFTLKRSRDKKAILKAMFTTEDDRLYVRKSDKAGAEGDRIGWVWFVYGNSGSDVICDYTTNLEPIMGPVNEWVEKEFG